MIIIRKSTTKEPILIQMKEPILMGKVDEIHDGKTNIKFEYQSISMGRKIINILPPFAFSNVITVLRKLRRWSPPPLSPSPPVATALSWHRCDSSAARKQLDFCFLSSIIMYLSAKHFLLRYLVHETQQKQERTMRDVNDDDVWCHQITRIDMKQLKLFTPNTTQNPF